MCTEEPPEEHWEEVEVGITFESNGAVSTFTASDFPVMEENQCSSTEGSEDEEVQWRVVDASQEPGENPDEEAEVIEEEFEPEEEESFTIMTPEENQRELNRLLERCETLKQKKDALEEECTGMITKLQFDDLYAYLKKTSEDDDAGVSDEDLSKYVLGRIGFEKVEVVDKLHQMLALESLMEQTASQVEQALVAKGQ